ncbi:MAG: O-antigen ligase family protein [Deltaproteobacteria bacterium]|nr:O-antigen ligase family protein [bacterium]MCB9477724.1 O-antigen ligase family protein [Deltaproteobacteria bacterium]MCB9478861.1 O-antigen ligase family protein [Deltaproteobacteria bacterium]MCB9488977.1 O-antigen ligase family protein [Deltaproteobacteria bacterium]
MTETTYPQWITRIQTHKDTRGVIFVAIAVGVCWAVGKAIAEHDFGVPLMVVALGLFALLFFKRESILWMAPAAMCVPNFGLDIPGPWAVSVEDAFVLVTIAAVMSRNILSRRPLVPRGDAVLGPMSVFWGIAVVSMIKVFSISPHSTMYVLKDLIRLTWLFLFYIVMIESLQTKDQVMRLMRALIVLAVPMALVSWYIYLTESPFFYYILTMKPAYIYYKRNFLRMISIAGSTSFTGLYYAAMLALAVTYPGLQRTKLTRLVRAAVILLIASCLVATLNRGTWVGVMFGTAMLILTGQMGWRKITVVGFLLTGIALLSATYVFSEMDVAGKLNVVVEVSRSSGTARLVRWISAVNVMLEQPLMGVGYNNYAFVYGRYSIEEGITRIYGSPHNMYIDVITGTGIIGFTAFIAFLSRLWKRHTANLRIAADPEIRSMAVGLFMAWTFFLGASFFDSFLFKPHHTTFIMVMLWAMTTALYRINLHHLRESEAKTADTVAA